MQKSQTIPNLIRKNAVKRVENLSTDAQNLFGLLTLIVDIKYRNRYGHSFEDQHGKGYSDIRQSNKVLADQKSPVDNGLQGM